MVNVSIYQSLLRSVRKHAAVLDLSIRSLRSILHKYLQMHPYKMILNRNSAKEIRNIAEYCEWKFNMFPLLILFFCDDAHFHLCGSVNRQNFRYWSQKNPHELHELPLHSPHVTIWCVIAEFSILGPYFFEEDSVKVIINSERHCVLLDTFLRPKMDEQK